MVSHGGFLFFIFILHCTGSLLLHTGFLQLSQMRATLQLQYMGFLLWCPLLLQSLGSGSEGFSSCYFPGPRAQAQ